jgi:catechol 2,3-dioxygenase-like lactoylglutathione lyase family enzyme
MATFRSPAINLYSRDLPRAVAFYKGLGFVETFRTPKTGDPVHVELKLDGFTLGIATIEAAKEMHGLQPEQGGRGMEIVLWSDDTNAAVENLASHGANILSTPDDFLDGKLRSAWVQDPDGNTIQIVQKKS